MGGGYIESAGSLPLTTSMNPFPTLLLQYVQKDTTVRPPLHVLITITILLAVVRPSYADLVGTHLVSITNTTSPGPGTIIGDVTYAITNYSLTRPVRVGYTYGTIVTNQPACVANLQCSGSLQQPLGVSYTAQPGDTPEKITGIVRSWLPSTTTAHIFWSTNYPTVVVCIAERLGGSQFVVMDGCQPHDLSKPPNPTICDITVPSNLLDHGSISPGMSPSSVSTNVQISCRGGKGGYSVSIKGPSSNGDLNMGNVKSTLSLDGTDMRVNGAGKNYPKGGNRTILLSSSLTLGSSAPGDYRASATIILSLI